MSKCDGIIKIRNKYELLTNPDDHHELDNADFPKIGVESGKRKLQDMKMIRMPKRETNTMPEQMMRPRGGS